MSSQEEHQVKQKERDIFKMRFIREPSSLDCCEDKRPTYMKCLARFLPGKEEMLDKYRPPLLPPQPPLRPCCHHKMTTATSTPSTAGTLAHPIGRRSHSQRKPESLLKANPNPASQAPPSQSLVT